MSSITVRDMAPSTQQFLRDVRQGLQSEPKSLPCKYLYDERGSQLFDDICELDEYYPTRTELAIMREHGAEMGERLGRGCVLVEYGSGSSLKTRLLLEHLITPAAYVPVDISKEHLEQSARDLAAKFSHIPVHPVCADFTAEFDIPDLDGRRNVYFPGSTIGNFSKPQAVALLQKMASLCRPHGGLLIGIDLKKDREILESAYNDREGVTAAFNRNLLTRINRELAGSFNVDQFRHEAFYNKQAGRMEIHLVSECDQSVRVDGFEVSFSKGESIHTESCHKYAIHEFHELAAQAGFHPEKVWTDSRELFSVHYLSLP